MAKQIFVSQIDFNITTDEFTKFIKDTFGEMEIKYFEHKGYAFLKTPSDEIYNKVMSSTDLKLNERIIRFKEYKYHLHGIHISGIPKTMKIDIITSVFSKFGNIESIIMDRDYITGEHRGSCKIEYTEHDNYKKVLEMKEVKIDDVVLSVTKRYINDQRKFNGNSKFNSGSSYRPRPHLNIQRK
jgi:RNA recognition motif-containing protein